MSGRHRVVGGERPRWWCAVFLASGLMLWATLLMTAGSGAPSATSVTAKPAIHPAAETTPNSLPRPVTGSVSGEWGGAADGDVGHTGSTRHAAGPAPTGGASSGDDTSSDQDAGMPGIMAVQSAVADVPLDTASTGGLAGAVRVAAATGGVLDADSRAPPDPSPR